MEARLYHAALVAVSLLSLGASYRTQNFIVTAPSAQFAREVGDAAESYRQALAIDWLGKELPAWSSPCPIMVDVGPRLGAGGATSFMFDNGRPFGWTMNIQGSQERILDSVLPHEVTHTIFATHFGRPLPRWADEGACTTVEHEVEKRKQKNHLISFLKSGRGIAFNNMFAMREYPQDVLPLYAQGYSLARFLIAHGGRRKFIDYVGDGMQWNDWNKATRKHYKYENLSELQLTWVDWVGRGSPPLQESPTYIAQQDQPNSETIVPVSLAAQDSRTASAQAPPVTRAVSDPPAAPQGGWYARVRDQTLSERSDSLAAGQAVGRGQPAGHSTPVRWQSQPKNREALSRPQPLQGVEEKILEWNRPNSPAVSPPPITRPLSPVVVPPQRTFWR